MYSHLNSFAARMLPSWIYEKLIGRWNAPGLKRYTQNTVWALAARIVSILVSFFVTIYLIRYLGSENYGQLSYAVSMVGLFATLASAGIDSVLYRELITHPDKRNEYLGSAFIMKLGLGAATMLCIVGAALMFGEPDVSRILICIIAGTFIFTPFHIIAQEFQADVAQKYVSIVSLIITIILNALKVAVIVSGQGVIYVALVLLLEPILYATGYLWLRTRHYASIRLWRFDSATSLSLLAHSWPFILVALFTVAYSRIDQIMLKHMIDASAVGLYDAAVRIAEIWLFIPGLIASVLFPALIHAKKTSFTEYRNRLLALCGMTVSFSILFTLIPALFSTPITVLLYGDSFIQSGAILQVYAWSSIFMALDSVLRFYLLAEHQYHTLLILTACTAIANILLNLLLIPRLGIIGAAWATLIAYTLLIYPLVHIIRRRS